MAQTAFFNLMYVKILPIYMVKDLPLLVTWTEECMMYTKCVEVLDKAQKTAPGPSLQQTIAVAKCLSLLQTCLGC